MDRVGEDGLACRSLRGEGDPDGGLSTSQPVRRPGGSRAGGAERKRSCRAAGNCPRRASQTSPQATEAFLRSFAQVFSLATERSDATENDPSPRAKEGSKEDS